MIFMYHARLAILSQPKTGTTALDNALGSRASIAISNPPQLKHIQYHKFMKFVAPWIEAQTGLGREDYEVVSVMREPVDWLGSWYRYRTRGALKEAKGNKKRKNYTGDTSFEDFVLEVIKTEKPKRGFARVGMPCSVALTANGAIGCDRIFPYEDLSGLHELVEARSGRALELDRKNVSPPGDLTLSSETLTRLRAAWPHAFDLHSSLQRDGSVEQRFKTGSAFARVDEEVSEET